MDVKIKKIFKYIFIIVFAVLFAGSVATNIRLGLSDRYFRNLSEQYRTELATAVDTNTELGRKLEESRRVIEDCRGTTKELGESVSRNIQSARGAIELLREIREKVILLESRLSDSNDDLNDNDSSAPSSEVKQYGKGKS
jgi:hypothetical protein